ncbi:helix-turn-helix transcriptional regulator [Plantactinospora sp. S1510]|uniref:Helix-turn-helix transcriptional regulator n=1 Tax=Plantactinospora alkalitolerans TaxID=2789879 RepID=A0ABS0GX33_9ACTN|nr:helix-turn-helix domain-containing protein [Plantactinospora alkalitolerans]MBF9130757.1 helix-turn-helix transcriptional regulator [Plantactinospora alkalitolerans]
MGERRHINVPWRRRRATPGTAVGIRVPVTCADRAACSASDVLHRVGDKWSVLVLSLLSQRGYGFNELDRAVHGLSRRMLTRTLRGLVRDGLVSRTPGPEVAARVEYALTGLGRSLLPLVVALGEWAVANQPVIGEARARHDAGITS